MSEDGLVLASHAKGLSVSAIAAKHDLAVDDVINTLERAKAQESKQPKPPKLQQCKLCKKLTYCTWCAGRCPKSRDFGSHRWATP